MYLETEDKSMKKIIISLVLLLMMAGCSTAKPQPVDEYSDEKLKEHGLEVVQNEVKLDFNRTIINATETVYSDKEGDGRGYLLIDEGWERWLAVFDRMFEEGNYYGLTDEFEPSGIIASALVDEDYTEYRQMYFQNEYITIYVAYDDFDIMNNVTSYNLGFYDDQYRDSFLLTLKKDNKVYLQKAEAEEMMGDFQSVRFMEEYPVFETQEKIERLYASSGDFNGMITESTSAMIITDKSVYLGFLRDEEIDFRKLEYLSGLRERIHFICIGKSDVTIVLKDGKVLRGDIGKLN